VAVALGTLVLCACSTTRQQSEAGFHPPSGNYRLIVMQPDIQVGQLTAGGVIEQREDWTNTARGNVLSALAEEQGARGAATKIASTTAEVGYDATATNDLIALHAAVGRAIQIHKFGPLHLPSKENHFDWTLGEPAVAFGAATHYDYALFLHAQDSFSSGGRVALQAAGMLGCLVGVCLIASGGQQVAFASLVDLKTGNVVWFNVLVSALGDIRTPDGAKQMVDRLLAGMNAPTTQATKRT
jgi:hypothetical protein